MDPSKQIQILKTKLQRIESELEKCRTSSYIDGWQTQKHAKKSRKWDMLAEEKRNLLEKIENYDRNIV